MTSNEEDERQDSVPTLSELETLTRGTEWGTEAFRDAGLATFGEK